MTIKELAREVHFDKCKLEKLREEMGLSQCDFMEFCGKVVDRQEAEKVAERYITNYLEFIETNYLIDNQSDDSIIYEESIRKIKDYTEK